MHVHVHVLFSLTALFATRARARARARVVFTGSTFAFDASGVSATIQTRLLDLQSHRETLNQMLDNTSYY